MTRHIPISELARALFPTSARVKAMAMLKAYFDDSGTHGESLITTISGYLCTDKMWEAVEGEWLAVLEDYRQHYGVTWFHACDVEMWQGDWRRVPLDVCREAPLRFARVLGAHKMLPVWAAVNNEDFERYATPEFRCDFPTPFTLCFHQAMEQLYRWAEYNKYPFRVAVFAAHGDYEDRINAAHRRYLSDGDFAAYIGGITFDEPRRVIPLQTADLLANQYYKYWLETEYPPGPHPRDPGRVFEECVRQNSSGLGGCYSKDGMKYAVEKHAKRIEERRSRQT